VLYVLGKYANEMSTLHLMKTCCLPALLYGVETWSLTNTGRHKVSVAWNISFRHIFHSCWRESVKKFAMFLSVAASGYLMDQRRLLFWQKMIISDNAVLLTLSRLIMIQFIAVEVVIVLPH